VARIEIRTDRPLGTVDERIFGGFIEHLGRCIYGGVFDEGSPLSDARGFRSDVLGAVRDLGLRHVRWPGGNFVSGYHWADGIGPPGQRPRRAELAWRSEEPNRFGTDEFMAWCTAAGVEPVLCLNMGTGTLDEALAWVEYCNGTGDTYWANRRRANGHEEPYRVRYWGLGNEMYGDWQIGQRTAADYVTTASQWAKAIRFLDPGVSLVSCGQSGVDDWDRVVIDGLARHVDLHSIHLYTGSDDYWSNVLAPHFAERALAVTGALIERARYAQRISHEIGVAYDEWNVWYRTDDGQLEERYTLSDALAVATYLNVFVRKSAVVRMANLAQLVNVIAPIVTSPGGMFLQSIYHPLRLISTATHEVALDTFVDSGTHAHSDRTEDRWPYRVADLGPFQLLDVAATRDAEGRRLTVSVVNRDPGQALDTRIHLAGARTAGPVMVHEVTGDSPESANSPAEPDAVTTVSTKRDVNGDVLDVRFAPHSFTLLEMQLA
jgi:alpha-L-arabinofuranosidase